MSADTSQTRTTVVTFDERERTELLTLVENALGETRAEVHHTHTPNYREQVQQREQVYRSIIEKLRHAGA